MDGPERHSAGVLRMSVTSQRCIFVNPRRPRWAPAAARRTHQVSMTRRVFLCLVLVTWARDSRRQR
ncbi:MAG: hypothetical protein OJF60_001108 [Burkholderiaceae bacterium]|nr:MAG: hypothetical protein OJF60_001108 [Burkholderiaceae bacterium]